MVHNNMSPMSPYMFTLRSSYPFYRFQSSPPPNLHHPPRTLDPPIASSHGTTHVAPQGERPRPESKMPRMLREDERKSVDEPGGRTRGKKGKCVEEPRKSKKRTWRTFFQCQGCCLGGWESLASNQKLVGGACVRGGGKVGFCWICSKRV